jgi:hypothetical protein
VGGPHFVHVNASIGEALTESACGTCMIEVDVSHHDALERIDPRFLETRKDVGYGGLRARFDQRSLAGKQETCGDAVSTVHLGIDDQRGTACTRHRTPVFTKA